MWHPLTVKKDSDQQPEVVLPSNRLKIKLPASKGLSRPAAEPHAAPAAQSGSVQVDFRVIDTVDTGHRISKRKRHAVDAESSADSDHESAEDPTKTEKAQKKRLHHSETTPSANVPKKRGRPLKSAEAKAQALALKARPTSTLSATIFVSVAQPPELVHGKTAKQDKLMPQKPHVKGPFTLTKYTTWEQFVDEVAESVGVEKENMRVSSLTWGFQKQKDVLPLTNENGFQAMQEQIRGKNSSGTIVFVYHPIISRAPTQVHQVKDDDEEKKDVSSGTHWGKKVSVEKKCQVYVATHVTA